MKTFFERFLEEVTRKLEAGEIDEEKAYRWIEELQSQLQSYATASTSSHCPNAHQTLIPSG